MKISRFAQRVINTTSFESWLDESQPTSVQDLRDLYDAIEKRENCGKYRVTCDDKETYVRDAASIFQLRLATNNAREGFLRLIIGKGKRAALHNGSATPFQNTMTPAPATRQDNSPSISALPLQEASSQLGTEGSNQFAFQWVDFNESG